MSTTYILIWMVLLLPVVWYVNFRIKRRRLYELASKLDGPPTIPILGNLLNILVSPDRAANAILEANGYYKSPTRLWIGPKLVVHIWDPKHIEGILSSQQHLEKGDIYRFADSIIGSGLVTLPVEQWKRHRRMISPVFNKTNLLRCFGIFNRQSKKLIEDLKSEDGKGVVDIEPYLARSIMKTVMKAILDFGGKKKNSDVSELVEWLNEVQTTAVKRFTTIWLFPDFIFNRTKIGKRHNKLLEKLNNFIYSIVEDWKEDVFKNRQNIVESTNTDSERPVKFVEHLLSSTKENGRLTDEELFNEAKTIILAAMDTTSSAVGYILILLGIHPEVQSKVYQEIMKHLGPASTGDIQYETLHKFDYLDRVIKEALRVFSTGVGMSRSIEEEIQLGEYTIPAGCTVLVGLISVHRDPKTWPNPTKFDPDRFLPEEVAKRHPYSWIPFSAGPRNCIGYQFALYAIKIFIINLVRNYEIGTCYKSVEDVDLTWMLVLKPTGGYKVSLTSRV